MQTSKRYDIIKENIYNIPKTLIYQKHSSERSVFT